MRFRNAIQAIFGGVKNIMSSAWREIGNYTAYFSSFGTDIYANDTVRACIRTLSEHSSKANVKVIRRIGKDIAPGDVKLQRMIQYRPNMYMNGKDFLSKVRTTLEINNVVFIYIMRDNLNRCIGIYPMPHGQYEAVEVDGRLYIKFSYPSGIVMAHSWEDLAVLRKDYNKSDIWGDPNDAILTSLDLLTTTNDGMANAIKSTANLRGIVKTKQAMMLNEDIKKLKDDFVKDYMNLTNTSGIAALDASLDFTPVDLKPQLANYKSVEDLRLNIYRYFGVNEDIIMSKASGDAWEAFYEAKLEPFLLALSLELTNKIYTDREKGFGNEILFEANRLQYASTTAKMGMVQLIDRGVLTINEYREILNLSPVEGGDIRVIRKEYAEALNLNEIQGVTSAGTKEGNDDQQGS